MKSIFIKLMAFFAMMATISANATTYAGRVTLEGNWYLQAGSIQNFTPGVNIVSMHYSMGALEDGTAVFQDYIAPDTRLGYLYPGSDRYQASDWGMDIAPNASWTFSGLDLDVLQSKSGWVVDDSVIDRTGGSLKNAFIELTFSDGFYKVLPLNKTGWDVTQVLEFGPIAPVSEPSYIFLLMSGLGMIGLSLNLRHQREERLIRLLAR